MPPGIAKEDVKIFVREDVKEAQEKSKKKIKDKEEETADAKAKIEAAPPAEPNEPSSSAPLSEETQNAAILPGDALHKSRANTANEGLTPMQQAAINTTGPNAPLERVLHMDPPADPPTDPSIPHLHAPPYVHHFDSWTLVKQVEEGGFTDAQAITAMKAVRGLLAHNLDVAKEGLVSKSDVENETYLFRAACSELRTEIQNTRRANEETMRRERTLLQHEVDILNQKLTQELMTLKDDLRGMFNDRKIAVREEQRSMESKIQDINYKITVALNSDSKSEVEGLRWVLTRRSVLGIIFMAFMVLSSLRYASYRAHEDEMERKRQEKQKETMRKAGHGRYVEGAVQTEGGEFVNIGVASTAAEALAAS